MNMQLIEKIRQHHISSFGIKPLVVTYAPGRVEVLGNHTDYNEGFVLSAAINLGIGAAFTPLSNKECTINAMDMNEKVSFKLPVLAPVRKPAWANYVLGVVNKLQALRPISHSFQATFAGDVPQGAGLSSSAALELATALALCSLCDIKLSMIDLAKICQSAEHDFAGSKCGLLDQISSIFGKEGSLIYTDFRTLNVDTVPLGLDSCFLVADTRIKHELVSSDYNKRRIECERAAAFFSSVLTHPVKSLRDVSIPEWKRNAHRLNPVLARRAAHIIQENQRVRRARNQLLADDLKGFGELMFESHQSSKVNFENSCPELDLLVDEARKMPQVLGARLSGGGFGGSVIILVKGQDAENVKSKLRKRFQPLFGHSCDISKITPSAGAQILAQKQQKRIDFKIKSVSI